MSRVRGPGGCALALLSREPRMRSDGHRPADPRLSDFSLRKIFQLAYRLIRPHTASSAMALRPVSNVLLAGAACSSLTTLRALRSAAGGRMKR
jgi:hypothetical protein